MWREGEGTRPICTRLPRRPSGGASVNLRMTGGGPLRSPRLSPTNGCRSAFSFNLRVRDRLVGCLAERS